MKVNDLMMKKVRVQERKELSPLRCRYERRLSMHRFNIQKKIKSRA